MVKTWPWKGHCWRITYRGFPYLGYPSSNQTWPREIDSNDWEQWRKEKCQSTQDMSLVADCWTLELVEANKSWLPISLVVVYARSRTSPHGVRVIISEGPQLLECQLCLHRLFSNNDCFSFGHRFLLTFISYSCCLNTTAYPMPHLRHPGLRQSAVLRHRGWGCGRMVMNQKQHC